MRAFPVKRISHFHQPLPLDGFWMLDQPRDMQAAERDWERLITQHYSELRRTAHAVVRHDGGSMQATELLHSVLRRIPLEGIDLGEPARLLAIVSWRLRRMLIDRARRRRAEKRGGGRAAIHFDPGRTEFAASERTFDLIDLNDALRELRCLDRRKWRLVELRFFGGLSLPDSAASLHISLSTAEKDWAFCRAWLQSRLGSS